MEMRRLGRTGLLVSRLGIGMAEAGFNLDRDSIARVKQLIDVAADAGINFLDTAACYGLSEEQIGHAVSGRRDGFVIATKASYLEEDSTHWYTAAAVMRSIDRSLQRLRVEHIDIIQLHSCAIELMEQGDAIDGLLKARQAGKVRYLGYSGDNVRARWAVRAGIFDTLQTSFNLVDQGALDGLFTEARDQEMGIIAKRPLANRVWGRAAMPFTYRHSPDYAAEYFQRATRMAEMGPITGAPGDDIALALGFVIGREEVDVAIAGTADPAHLAANIAIVESEMPLPAAAIAELQRRFEACRDGWEQVT